MIDPVYLFTVATLVTAADIPIAWLENPPDAPPFNDLFLGHGDAIEAARFVQRGVKREMASARQRKSTKRYRRAKK